MAIFFGGFSENSGNFSRFSAIGVTGGKEERTSETVRGSVFSNWLGVFGPTGIMATGEDSIFIGGEFFVNFSTLAV